MSEKKKKKKLKLNTKGFSQAGLAQGLALKRKPKYKKVVTENWKITDGTTGQVKRIKIKPLKQARVKKNTSF